MQIFTSSFSVALYIIKNKQYNTGHSLYHIIRVVIEQKNILTLIEEISWLSISEILHKAPPRLITKATETYLHCNRVFIIIPSFIYSFIQLFMH